MLPKSSSLFFTLTAAVGLVIVFSAPAALTHMRCDQVFLPAPLSTFIGNDKPVKKLKVTPVSADHPAEKWAHTLMITLPEVTQHPDRTSWVALYQLTAKVPKDTEEIQYLGYNIMRTILKATDIFMPDDGAIYVSLKMNSIQDVIDHVIEEADIRLKATKDREDIEQQIEMLAAAIGAPHERIIIQTSINERTGTAADMFGSGIRVNAITIINRNTGIAVDIDFFEKPQHRRRGPGIY